MSQTTVEAAFERHYSVDELCALWSMSDDFVRRLFLHEPGVVVFYHHRPGRRVYRTVANSRARRPACPQADVGAGTVLAEVLALRTILLNTHYATASGEALTADKMGDPIARADQHKRERARQCLAQTASPSTT